MIQHSDQSYNQPSGNNPDNSHASKLIELKTLDKHPVASIQITAIAALYEIYNILEDIPLSASLEEFKEADKMASEKVIQLRDFFMTL
jgi:hypothetical protein